MDEIHIGEDLVYNKHNGELFGFVEIYNHLLEFESDARF